MANHRLSFDVSDNYVFPEVEKQIGQSLDDFKAGKFITYNGSIDDLLAQID